MKNLTEGNSEGFREQAKMTKGFFQSRLGLCFLCPARESLRSCLL